MNCSLVPLPIRKLLFRVIFVPILLVCFAATAKESRPNPPATLVIREIRYAGTVSDDEARFTLNIDADATGESSLPLIEGDVAVLPAKLPDSLQLRREGNRYILSVDHDGHFKCSIDVVAKIQHAEPWNQVSFVGPMATIASVSVQAPGTETEIQLLTGTILETIRTNSVSRLTGFLGAERNISLRWQSHVAKISHKALLTVDSAINASVSPTLIKYTGKFHYSVVQGTAAELTLALPVSQALTHLDGDGIRDWHLAAAGDHQTLTIDFIKPVETSFDLTLYSEQAIENAAVNASLNPPQPLAVERESGSLIIAAEDTLVEITAPAGLRQVNAPDNAIAAYQFNSRPLTLVLQLKPIEPVINVADRVSAQLEETRLLVSHSLALNIEKAGIYTLELTPQSGFVVGDVRGDGIEDWNVNGGKIHINFSARVLGWRQINIQLEQSLKTFPDKIAIAPLHVTGAMKETARIGAASTAGIRLRTAETGGLREIPVRELQAQNQQMPVRLDEILAYNADQSDWQLSIACEKLQARVVADVFNLVTIGDGILGGSATIRYGLANQGVQEFRVRVPAGFKNVEFTGPNIRRKEQSGDVWTIGLQDKVWGGYTLVVTYDHQFNLKDVTLPVGGIHVQDVERETGSIAITTASSLELNVQNAGDTLRRIDETELAAADRSVITRAVVLAYQYTGDQYDLSVGVKRFAEQSVLDAVADRTQITSVLTDSGQMLTQASFMVKNNDKQFQRFQLPAGATLWGCYVNGQSAKPERDNEWVLVPLPRDADRDQTFAVDIMYAQTNGSLASTFGKTLQLNAPRTDLLTTYAEWQLFVPPAFRLSDFSGSMNVAQGTTYELLDAWQKFVSFYGDVLREAGGTILFLGLLSVLVVALVISAVRRGWSGVITLLAVVAILAVLGAMLLPALASAKRKAQRINSVNNLKQVGLAAHIFAGDNTNRLPMSFEEMKDELSTDKITYDTETGQRYTYLGSGMSLDDLAPDSVLAYSPIFKGHCEVLYADGSVSQMSAGQFAELSQRGLVRYARSEQVAEQQRLAIARGQMAEAPPMISTMPAPAGGMPAATPPPVVAGIRSIRIELPQSGQPFLFTKVLNIRDEPLSIGARLMPLRTVQAMQMAWQTAAFLIGLVMWFWQWRRVHRNTFLLTVALALIVGSICSLLVQWRALHDALIVGFPVAVVALVSILVWKYWPRSQADEKTDSVEPIEPKRPEPPASSAGIPPVVATIVLLFALSMSVARAADSRITDHASLIASADYAGTVNDRVAMLDATLQFSSVRAGETITLFHSDVAIRQFAVKNGNAELIRDGDNLAVKMSGHGNVTLQVKMLVKIAGDVTKRRLNFAIPQALTTRVALTLNESQAEVDFPAAVSFKRVLEKDTTRVDAVMGSADHVELLWTPRVKRAEEVAATVFCQNNSLVTFGNGVMNVRATMDYQISQGELRQARVQLPAGQRLLRVEGNGIRTWEINSENGATVLVVDLLKGMSPSWRLIVETEKNLDALPATETVLIPHTLDVKRETGLIALSGTEELGLSVQSSAGLQRVDAISFPAISLGKINSISSVFQFSAPDFKLSAQVQALQPELAAIVQNNMMVGVDHLSLLARINYTIKRVGVFSLKLALPEGYRVERVDGGNIQQWTDNGGVLELTLKDRTSGAYPVSVQLSRELKQLPKALAVAGVHPLDVSKLTEFVAITADAGVAVKTGTFDGLTEIPVTDLPKGGFIFDTGAVLAYKFISANPKTAPEWNLSLQTETVAAWVRAEIVDTFTLTESLITGRATVRYDIANAPVKELRLRVPEHFQNVDISGANIRSREQDGNVWRLELQTPVKGSYTLTVTWEQARSTKTNAQEIAGISAEGVERETGLLAVSAKSSLQVAELNASELQRVDTGDFPEWAGTPDPSTAIAYRYSRPDYKLTLDVRRFNEAEVLQAIIDKAQFTSVVADDGQMMTEMAVSLRSNGRQFLAVELPAGARVWSAFVAGQPVRPSVRDGKLLLPIEQAAADDSAMSVQLTYVGTNSFPRGQGQVGFVSPRFDVPLKNARWEIFLPPDYRYNNFAGTMTHELAAVATTPESPSVSFSGLEYSRMEQENKSATKVEVKRDVDEARRQLANGNAQAAGVILNRARTHSFGGSDGELKELEKDLQKTQASNFVEAQSDFVTRNSWAADKNGPVQSAVQYDGTAAGEQLSKLQQAQQIVAATVRPLHVNLPVRGRYLAFSQVLQTETGKPMTIQLFAANTKSVSWMGRAAAIAGAFIVLWIGVTILSGFTSRTRMV